MPPDASVCLSTVVAITRPKNYLFFVFILFEFPLQIIYSPMQFKETFSFEILLYDKRYLYMVIKKSTHENLSVQWYSTVACNTHNMDIAMKDRKI